MTQRSDNGATALRSGQVANQLGVGVQTLHYYERDGLIPAAPRSEAVYRLFPPELIERLRFIRRAQALGLSLAEIKEMLVLVEIGESPCGRVQTALAEKLGEVDRRLDELTAFRNQLAEFVKNVPMIREGERTRNVCAIVETAVPLSGSEFVNVPLGRRRRAGK